MRKPLAVVLSVLFATTLAACSDDGGDDDASGSASGSASGTEDTADDSDDTTTTDGGGDAEASAEFCAQADSLANDDTLDELDFDNEDDVELIGDLLNDWADNAPGSIEDDIRFMAEQIGPVSVAFEDAFDPDAEPDPELQALFDEYAAAGERVEEFVDEACDIDLSGDTGDTDDTDDTDDGSSGPDDSAEEFADLIESCQGGDMADCDDLFLNTPVGSEAEQIGRTCGGRGDETTAFQCEELFG